jgi:Raf kinase inhibitor-like YbhB/YbcL family protein
MSTSRLFLISSLLLVACPADDADDTGAGTGTDPGSSSSSTLSTTEPGSESSTSPVTIDPSSSSSGEDSGTTAADESTTMLADSSSSTTEPVEFTLTSTEFTEGEGIPHSAHVDGGNQSPALDWVGAPAGTMSFAVFFHDLDFDFNHSAIWNISADLTGLPHDVDHDAMPADVPGALQCASWHGEFGYGGPGSESNHYEFILYALDVETIPETEIDSGSNLGEVFTAFEAHSLGTATLSGYSTGAGM